jgi:hypothetical protein
MFFSGFAEVEEWYDDSAQCFKIEVIVRNAIWGPLFGYRGSFKVRKLNLRKRKIPNRAFPLRFEKRE